MGLRTARPPRASVLVRSSSHPLTRNGRRPSLPDAPRRPAVTRGAAPEHGREGRRERVEREARAPRQHRQGRRPRRGRGRACRPRDGATGVGGRAARARVASLADARRGATVGAGVSFTRAGVAARLLQRGGALILHRLCLPERPAAVSAPAGVRPSRGPSFTAATRRSIVVRAVVLYYARTRASKPSAVGGFSLAQNLSAAHSQGVCAGGVVQTPRF